jgi:hypothetical protein
MGQRVRNQIYLTDTILVSKWVGTLTGDRPPGWFTTFADVGRTGTLHFMNVRNRSVPGGVCFNNQDARDQLPYGMRIQTIGVKFLTPACASQFTACQMVASPTNHWSPQDDGVYTDPSAANTQDGLLNREELHSAIWDADLPNHCSLTLRTNQDQRLKGPCALFPPGYGAVGGGWGWGSPGGWENTGEIAGNTIECGDNVTNHQAIEHGEVDLRQRWMFPVNLEVPKRSSFEIVIELNQYARDMLQAIPGPFWHSFPYGQLAGEGPIVGKLARAALFGVQLTVHGERLIQPRAEYEV